MRFTIRDLLLLTLVVGLAVGWGVDHWAMASAEWREKAVYRSGAAHALKLRFADTGHSVEFIEMSGVKIDGKLILISGTPDRP